MYFCSTYNCGQKAIAKEFKHVVVNTGKAWTYYFVCKDCKNDKLESEEVSA